jgi:hypothetical protein
MNLLERYLAGEHEEVWSDLMALGHEARNSTYFPQAYAVAKETMQRARRNVERLVARLHAIGYQFANPQDAHVPPITDVRAMIASIEETLGPLPLSLRAFYEVVGSVDFTQADGQLVRYHQPERETATELELLGEEDPLIVYPIWRLEEEIARGRARRGRLYFCFAPDELHKAGYSGGENYHVWLPDPYTDFEIAGMYGIDEPFVAYLRATFAHGGFRGRVKVLEDDESKCRKVAPRLGIVEQLAEDLWPL